MKPANVALVIFDLDGTLVDSAPDLAWCADRMLEDLSLPLLGLTKTRDYLGNGLFVLVKRVLTQQMNVEPEPVLFEKALPIFMQYYRNNVSQFSQLYNGTVETLEILKSSGIKLACATNKAEEFALILLKHLQIDKYFNIVIGGDTLEKKKPDPLPLLYIARRLNAALEQCIMVGDSQHDIFAAKAAGMRVVAVPYGYNHGEKVSAYEPDFMIETLADLPALLKTL